jgi:hypothetical protein
MKFFISTRKIRNCGSGEITDDVRKEKTDIEEVLIDYKHTKDRESFLLQ